MNQISSGCVSSPGCDWGTTSCVVSHSVHTLFYHSDCLGGRWDWIHLASIVEPICLIFTYLRKLHPPGWSECIDGSSPRPSRWISHRTCCAAPQRQRAASFWTLSDDDLLEKIRPKSTILAVAIYYAVSCNWQKKTNTIDRSPLEGLVQSSHPRSHVNYGHSLWRYNEVTFSRLVYLPLLVQLH